MKNKFKFALMAFATLIASSTMVSCGDDDEIKPDGSETSTATPISTYATYNGVTYFKYPVMKWGASVSTIKSKMSGFTIYEETSTMLTYNSKYKEFATLYSLESGKLKASAIGISSSSISTQALTSILGKDFKAVGTDEENYKIYYVNTENKLACVLSFESSGSSIYYLLMWFEYDSSSTRANGIDVELLRNKYNEIKPTFVI